MRPKVLIYRSDWLNPSEGFVSDHGLALERYAALTVGLRQPAPADAFPGPAAWATGRPDPSPVARYGFRALGIAPALDRLIEQHRPALLHAHFATDALDLLPLARRHRLPLVVTLHGYDLRAPLEAGRRWRGDSINWRLRGRQLWRDAAIFLPVSESLRAEALAAGFPQDKLVTHYLGTALGLAPPLPLDQRAGIVYVGRLIERKGLGDLLAALGQLREGGQDFALEVVGDGPARGRFEQQARALGIAVRFHGTLPRSSAQELMAGTRVFAMPARQEPFGLVFIEAQNAGTPVVAYAEGGACEAVIDQTTGLLAAPGDIAALASAIARLMADDAVWGRLSGNGVAHVRRQFDIRQQSARLEAIYDGIIATRAPA